jgi:hypothetical protein
LRTTVSTTPQGGNGGSVSIDTHYSKACSNTTFEITGSTFTDIDTFAGVVSIYLLNTFGILFKVVGCHFKNISLRSVDSATARPSVISVDFGGSNIEDSVEVVDSTFTHVIPGGSITILHNAATGAVGHGAAVIICNCSFTRSQLSADGAMCGGGVFIGGMHSAALVASISITESKFQDNEAAVHGGAICIDLPQTEITGVEIDISSNYFANNIAGQAGGAVYIALPPGQKSNLNFVGNPETWEPDDDFNNPCSTCAAYPNCSGCPAFAYYGHPHNPVIPIANVYRHWDHQNNRFLLNNNTFSSNVAGGSGGALVLANGGAGTVSNSIFDGNIATVLSGGGTSVTGNAQVSFENTQWKGNVCGLDGCQVSQASSADVSFSGNCTIELGCVVAETGVIDGNCRQGVSAAAAGNATWGAMAGMSCAPGYILVNESVLSYPTQIDSWVLEPHFAVVVDGADYHALTNCPCYFTSYGYPIFGFGNSTVKPEMLVSTLAYSCRACPAGTFSVFAVRLSGNDNATTVGSCTVCPAGRHQFAVGQSMCLACPAGQSQAESGQKGCPQCPDGTFQLDSGATSCVRCPVGGTCSKGGLVPKANHYGSRISMPRRLLRRNKRRRW